MALLWTKLKVSGQNQYQATMKRGSLLRYYTCVGPPIKPCQCPVSSVSVCLYPDRGPHVFPAFAHAAPAFAHADRMYSHLKGYVSGDMQDRDFNIRHGSDAYVAELAHTRALTHSRANHTR